MVIIKENLDTGKQKKQTGKIKIKHTNGQT